MGPNAADGGEQLRDLPRVPARAKERGAEDIDCVGGHGGDHHSLSSWPQMLLLSQDGGVSQREEGCLILFRV